MGNICRSPAAEIIFRKKIEDAGLGDRVEIDSAGTIGFHAGNPPDPRMAEHLKRRGYRVFGSARHLSINDLGYFDLILTMDEENLSDVLQMKGANEVRAKIVPFVDYLRGNPAVRIPDPYYGGDKGFAQVIDLLEDGCSTLVEDFLDK